MFLVATCGVALVPRLHAQDDARAKLLIPDIAGLTAELGRFPRGAPATSIGSPTAFGANWGDVYFAAGLQAPIRGGAAADGAVTIGFGLLDAERFVGLDVSVTDLSTVNTGWGKRLGLNVKLHRILPDDWGIAVGGSTYYLSSPPTDANASLYGVISKVFNLDGSVFKALTLSAGAGNEAFRSAQDIQLDNKTFGAFGSAALRVVDRLSVIVDWPGQDLDVGLSFVPIRSWGIVLTPAAADILGTAVATGPGEKKSRPRFSLGAGWVFAF